MPYEMNDLEKTLWDYDCRHDRTLKYNYIGLKYKWWVEGSDVIFDKKLIPNFKKLWKDYLKES